MADFVHTVAIPPALSGERLDKALVHLLPTLSRSRLQALLELGHVTLDTPAGSRAQHDGAAKVRTGQLFTVVVPEVAPSRVEAQAMPLSIIYEDAHLLVIDKSAGMTVHPAPGSPDRTLVNALLAHCGESLSGIGGVARPGIVHRIDKETSGLLAVAKHDTAHHHLSAQLSGRTLKRTYLAIAWGVPVPLTGTITGNIGRHPKDRQRMAVLKEGGKHAVTHYRVVETFPRRRESTVTDKEWTPAYAGVKASLLECRLETGRTHQIRVHLAHIGHPLVGDPVYGRAPAKRTGIPPEALSFPRQALHAWKLELIHPASGEAMAFEAPLPADFQALLAALRQAERAINS